MKLLIVDDETLTREGLIASIDWAAMGITQVFQADDGVNGLEIAKAESPEIILCDVRMPRMDGIQMVERLAEYLPDSAVIFMSGYSDKEYLKAAIKLKAVNYVEKPLDPREIRDAILEAQERFRQKLRTRRNEEFHSMSTASALAMALTRPYKEQKESISAMTRELSIRHSGFFTAYVAEVGMAEPDADPLEQIREALEAFLARYHFNLLYVSKHERFQVFHVYGPKEPSGTILAETDRFLARQYASLNPFYLARGETVSGISRAYHSYACAVTLMQSSFFFASGTVLTTQTPLETRIREPLDELPGAFARALADKDRETCKELLGRIFHSFFQHRDILPHQAKDLYYKLFTILSENRQKLKLPPDLERHGESQSILEFLEGCFNLDALHHMLAAGVENFFLAAQSHSQEDPTVFLIKEFIARNFSDEGLSVREISEHVHLSASYVCTYFKNETGQTLNQYLTAYRMERAKQLLGDSRYQIADISSKVGYSNGNYFSKSFKKLAGLSPSEYREKMLQ